MVDVGRDESGKRKQRWQSAPTKREAERLLADLLGELHRGEYVEPSRQTVQDFLESRWLPSIRASVREGTFESYSRNVRAHIVPRLGQVPLQRLDAAALNRFYADLLRNGRRDGSGGLAPRTVRYIHTILRRALAAGVRWDVLTRNPADLADPPSPKASRPKPLQTWSAAELREFLDGVREQRLFPLFLTLAATGMRRGEALGARWQDVDLDAGRWQVRRTLVAVGHELRESTPKTDHGRRSIALDPGTVRALREWRKRQLEERMAWGPAWTDTGRVYTREDGTDLHPERVSELFGRLVRRSGLRRIRVHDLRHSHASHALEAGISAKVVSERLGHSSVAFTLDTYSHVVPALEEDAAARVAALVGLDA